LLPAEQVVNGHAQSLGFGIQQRVFDGAERLGAQPVRGGSRGGRKGGVEALVVVYGLADQPVGIPLDDGREAGRPEGLVEFAPANDTVFRDKLEKVVIASSGIAGQRFDPLDLHGSHLSLRVGSLATASLPFYLSNPRLVRGHQQALCYGACPRAPSAPATLGDAWVVPGQGERWGTLTRSPPGAHT
jgi:hypothetical protein